MTGQQEKLYINALLQINKDSMHETIAYKLLRSLDLGLTEEKLIAYSFAITLQVDQDRMAREAKIKPTLKY